MQWVKDSNQHNTDNLNNVRCEASRHFRNKKEYLKTIGVLYRGIIDLRVTILELI
jgi:hypothetical protein